MTEQRYCLVGDGDGHQWMCPLDRKPEVEENIEAIEDYWATGDYDKECPKDLTQDLPRVEGETLSFTSPHLNGKPVFDEDE